MMKRAITNTSGRGTSHGFTLIEAVISIALVGLLVVAALHASGNLALTDRATRERQMGQALATDLMTEILTRSYIDPTALLPLFGAESLDGELLGPGRTRFDDVDDYNSWNRSPPETLNGTDIPGLADWSRSVSVAWVQDNQFSNVMILDTGVKRITVTVKHKGRVVGKAVAIRTSAWGMDEHEGIGVLFVVANPEALTSVERGRLDLMQSWGLNVTLIDDSENQSAFDDAIAEADVAYVGPDISDDELADKLTGKSIGIVNEFNGKLDNFGFSSNPSGTADGASVTIEDNVHDITSGFDIGELSIFTSGMTMRIPSGTLAPGLDRLADIHVLTPAIVTLDTGAERYDGDDAPARRVHLPFSNAAVNQLTDDARTIFIRSLQWAAGTDEDGGGGGLLLLF